MTYLIYDWTCRQVFDEEFISFDDAEEFLTCYFDMNNLDYDKERGEYFIQEKGE